MGDLARPEHVCAGSGARPLAIANERHLAFKDIERFILEMVCVVRRCKPGWHRLLDKPERAVGRLPGGSENGGKPQKVDWRFLACVDVWLQRLRRHRALLCLLAGLQPPCVMTVPWRYKSCWLQHPA